MKDLQDIRPQEVRFRNPLQDIPLAGMLFWPEKEGKVPAVVIIHGSGSSRRDNPWYRALVRYLQQQGIAVLLPDKRGSGSSGGDWRTASFEDLATDTLAAVSFLHETYPSKISAIGLLGVSQGGQVAPIVAAESNRIAFVISLVSSVVPFHKALLYEEENNLRAMGFPPPIAAVFARLSSWYIRTLAQRSFWKAVGNYDPLGYWARVNVPALVVFGERDTRVPTRESAERLRALGNPQIRVVVLPSSGHALEDPEDSNKNSIREDALALIAEFIRSSVSSR